MTTEERLLNTVSAGMFHDRVTILNPTAEIDTYGRQVITYAPGNTVWAYIETHSTQVYKTTGQTHITRKTLIVMRYRTGLNEKTRYQVDGHTFRSAGTPQDACGKHKLTYVECIEEYKDV